MCYQRKEGKEIFFDVERNWAAPPFGYRGSTGARDGISSQPIFLPLCLHKDRTISSD
jgi:hypothetical protein